MPNRTRHARDADAASIYTVYIHNGYLVREDRPDTTHETDAAQSIRLAAETARLTLSVYNAKRLEALFLLLDMLHHEGLVVLKTPVGSETCLLGWNEMEVLNPIAVLKRVEGMVSANTDDIWSHTSTCATQPVYELFTSIGLRPKTGSMGSPDPHVGIYEMIYYKVWRFKNDSKWRDAYKAKLAHGPERRSWRRKLTVGTGDASSHQSARPFHAPS